MNDPEVYQIMCHFLVPVFTTTPHDISKEQKDSKIENELKSKYLQQQKKSFTISLPNKESKQIKDEKGPKQPSSFESSSKSTKQAKVERTERTETVNKIVSVDKLEKSDKYERSQRSQQYEKPQSKPRSQKVAIEEDSSESERSNRFQGSEITVSSKGRRSQSRNAERETDTKRRRRDRDERIRDRDREDQRKRDIDQWRDERYDASRTKTLKHKGDDYNNKKDIENSLLCYCESIIGYTQLVLRKEMNFQQIKELLNFVYMLSERNKSNPIGNGVNKIISQLYLHLLWNDHPNVGDYLKDDELWKENIIPCCLIELKQLEKLKH